MKKILSATLLALVPMVQANNVSQGKYTVTIQKTITANPDIARFSFNDSYGTSFNQAANDQNPINLFDRNFASSKVRLGVFRIQKPMNTGSDASWLDIPTINVGKVYVRAVIREHDLRGSTNERLCFSFHKKKGDYNKVASLHFNRSRNNSAYIGGRADGQGNNIQQVRWVANSNPGSNWNGDLTLYMVVDFDASEYAVYYDMQNNGSFPGSGGILLIGRDRIDPFSSIGSFRVRVRGDYSGTDYLDIGDIEIGTAF